MQNTNNQKQPPNKAPGDTEVLIVPSHLALVTCVSFLVCRTSNRPGGHQRSRWPTISTFESSQDGVQDLVEKMAGESNTDRTWIPFKIHLSKSCPGDRAESPRVNS